MVTDVVYIRVDGMSPLMWYVQETATADDLNMILRHVVDIFQKIMAEIQARA
jgi:hypothetical protein